MYKQIAREYINEIHNDYNLSKLIFDKVGIENEEIVTMINHSTIISMCIKYEAFSSDLMAFLRKRKVEYNHPWSYTRGAANILKLEISREYDDAHDAWEYYNSLKHVNSQSIIQNLKFSKEHGISDSWQALRFVHESLIALLERFA